MIRQNKNIQKLKVLYEEAKKSRNIEGTVVSINEDGKEKQQDSMEHENEISFSYIKSDLIKTGSFILFASLIVFLSYISLNNDSFTNSVLEKLPFLQSIKINK